MQFADLGEQFRILVDILEEKRIDSAEFLDTVLADFDDDLDDVLPMPVDFPHPTAFFQLVMAHHFQNQFFLCAVDFIERTLRYPQVVGNVVHLDLPDSVSVEECCGNAENTLLEFLPVWGFCRCIMHERLFLRQNYKKR